jgi:hypothetical protein
MCEEGFSLAYVGCGTRDSLYSLRRGELLYRLPRLVPT